MIEDFGGAELPKYAGVLVLNRYGLRTSSGARVKVCGEQFGRVGGGCSLGGRWVVLFMWEREVFSDRGDEIVVDPGVM